MPIVRQKLTIKQVHEPKSFGTKGGQKVEFTCDDGKKWITWKKSLFPYIVAGATIDADTEIKDRKTEDATYTDRILHEIYVEGKAVAWQAKQTYRSDGDSPEKRSSIEAQQAAQFVTQLWIAGKVQDDSPEVKGLKAWLLARLNPEGPQKPAEPAKTKPPAKAGIEVATPGEITLAVPKEQVSSEQTKPKAKRDPMTIKNYTQLCKACHEDWGMQPKDVLDDLNVGSQSEITQTMPECYITIAAAREVPKEQE